MDPREPPYDRVVGRREIGTDGNAFVGRERELRVLQEELAETLSGRGRLVTIVGDAGIGKTRIIEEFVSRAADAPSRTLWGRCPEQGGAPAYWPWIDAIRKYVAGCEPGCLAADLGASAHELTQLVPEIRGLLPDLDLSPVIESDEWRFRLCDRVVEFLRRASARNPLVIVLDDLHWSDAAYAHARIRDQGVLEMRGSVVRAAGARRAVAGGAAYLATLVHEPGREFHVLDLAIGRDAPEAARVDRGDAGDLLDSAARAAYKRRLADLEAELDEAERFNDAGRMARAHEEREFLTAELARAIGLLPNAGIGWKQPNGFYYAPAFHSTNLFFADGERSVDIRHFVTEPLFDKDTFDTDVVEVKKFYCYRGTDQPKPGMFQGFTDIDRETVLNDDDGTLTGLTSKGAWIETISVNKEPFFDAPEETPECASDLPLNAAADAKCAPNTAKTSPYEYVTTAIYPECALAVSDLGGDLRKCMPYVWGSNCTTSDPAQNNSCVGVRLYRQLRLTKDDPFGDRQLKRMMGQNTFQRSALTANHGIYYIDTTVSAATQAQQGAKSINTFVGGQKYDLFFLYAKKSTQQVYQLYVGTGKKGDFGTTNVKFGYMNIVTAKYRFSLATPPDGKGRGELPKDWMSVYDPKSGYLTLLINMESLADDFDLKKPADPTNPTSPPLGQMLCQPKTMCGWNQVAGTCTCAIDDPKNYLYKACHEKNAANRDAICSWSVKDLDCPAKGCPALQIALEDYTPDDAADHHRPAAVEFSDPLFKKNWDVALSPVGAGLAGSQCTYPKPPPVCAP